MAGSAIDIEPPVSQAQLLLTTPVFVGCLLSFLLLGVSIVQLYIYYVSFRRDHWYIRVLVYSTFFADLLQSAAAAGHGYGTLCEQWGRPKAGALEYWWNPPLPIISSTLALWCQTFYAWRIYQLSGNRYIPIFICILSLAQMGGAYAISIITTTFTYISGLHGPVIKMLTILWLGGGALADIFIMVSMVYLLLSTRNSSFIMHRSELLINRLIIVSIETGCACALTASLELITFEALPKTALHYVFAFMLGKVYSNTLMVSLNNRRGPGPWLPAGAKTTTATTDIFSIPQFRITNHTQAESTVPSGLNPSTDAEHENENDTKVHDKNHAQQFELSPV